MSRYYKQKPLFKRVYTFPIYVMPVMVAVSNSRVIVPLFMTLFSIFLFLLTCWSYKFEILFSMHESKRYTHILYKKSLCKVTGSIFVFEKSKYMIKDGKIIKLSPDVSKTFGYYKNEYSCKPFVDPQLLEKFNKNYFNIDPPSFMELFMEHAVSPFFVFQIFCGILWCLDEYIYQALFTIFMLVLVECGLVFQRLINFKQFRTMNHNVFDVKLIGKSGKSEKIATNVSSLDLFPGDVIKIDSCCKIPCDLLILKGSCAVNEAMLSGESIPLTKEDISETDSTRCFDINKDKKHVLYAGTELVKIEGSSITCFVLFTGFDTRQGELIKKMMCRSEVNVNNTEAFAFIGFLLLFAITAALYTMREGIKMGKDKYKIFLEMIIIITNVVPTELPMELSMAVNSCVRQLVNLGIYCLEPFRIPMAGKVNICCFDKTGTLTETSMDVSNVVQSTKFTVDVLRTCHSMVFIGNSNTGDPLDIAIYEYINKIALASNNYQINDNNINLKNKALVESINSTLMTEYKILKKYLFSSELRRLTVVYECDKNVYVSMKGAPEMVKTFIDDVPEKYDDYRKYAMNGYRVIALAFKPYKKTGVFNRRDVEKGMKFAGFVLFDCKLKENAKETVKTLQDSNHKIVMITGDNLLTAMSVSNRLGIASKGVEGEDINEVLYSDQFEDYNIFARADPQQKEKILERYNALGKYTLMCGDGTNDVGALKAAHIGVAFVEGGNKSNINANNKTADSEKKLNPQQKLLQKLAEEINDTPQVQMGDASIAAPFTAKTGSLTSVLDIIRQGRSALVTTVQMYKILALNSLINAFSLSFLDCLGVRYGEYQMIASGILIAFAFLFLTSSTPLKEISKKMPLTTIFNKYIMFSLILQFGIHIATYFMVVFKLKSFEKIEYKEKFEPSLANTCMFYLGTAQQISTFLVNYIGRPFRENLHENKKLLMCLLSLMCFIFYLIFDFNQELSSLMEVVKLPDSLKSFISGILIFDIFMCYVVEKLCFYFFML